VVGHLVMMDRYQEALAEAERVVERFSNAPIHIFRAIAYWELGREEEALSDLRVAVGRRPTLLDSLKAGYERSGPRGAVAAAAGAAARNARESGAGAFGVATWYGRAQDADNAMEWLERAYEDRTPDLIYIALRPELRFLRGDRHPLPGAASPDGVGGGPLGRSLVAPALRLPTGGPARDEPPSPRARPLRSAR